MSALISSLSDVDTKDFKDEYRLSNSLTLLINEKAERIFGTVPLRDFLQFSRAFWALEYSEYTSLLSP